MMEINGRTQMLCLIGSPVGHSGSPSMYNYSFNQLGLNYAYLAYEIQKEDTKKAVDALKLLNVRGFNITMPCKTEVVKCCDHLSKAAELIGAVNTVVNDNGVLTGHNTDGIGWVRSLREEGVEITGKKMTLVGAGGAATAIAITCALEGMREISIFVRRNGSTYANAEETVKKIRTNVPSCEIHLYELEDRERFYLEIADSDIFTNGTKVGMKPMDEESLIDEERGFHEGLVVADVVYNPRETKLLKEAKAHGCKTVGGIGMLLWQGAEAFRLYTGKEMPVSEVQDRYFRG